MSDVENDALTEALFVAALSADNRPDDERNRQMVQGWIDDIEAHWPVSKCHDWRNHVPDVVYERWSDLPVTAKLVAFISAADAAHKEDWE